MKYLFIISLFLTSCSGTFDIFNLNPRFEVGDCIKKVHEPRESWDVPDFDTGYKIKEIGKHHYRLVWWYPKKWRNHDVGFAGYTTFSYMDSSHKKVECK